MGMDAKDAMTFDKRDYATNRAAFASAQASISRKRMAAPGSAAGGFSDEDRKRAMGR